MVVDYAINWVTDEQIEKIVYGSKRAFIRMEDTTPLGIEEDFQKHNEIQLHIRTLEPRGWLTVTYVDYFKWKELKIQHRLIQKCGFFDRLELKKYLYKLYGDIIKDENPYLYYIEFDYKPFPD